MTIGEKIKFHRKKLGLTQTELGVKLGVQKNAVSKWECGRVDGIPASKIKAMAALFDVPNSYLFDDEAQEKPTPISESGLSTDYDRLNAKNKAVIDSMIEMLLRSQSDD